VLGLGGGELGRMVKSEITPRDGFIGTIPTCMARRADQHAQQVTGHCLYSCLGGCRLLGHRVSIASDQHLLAADFDNGASIRG
jgi:hypothetical protein